MKVLFCTDGSEISLCTLKNFSRWGRDVELDAICVADWSFLPPGLSVDDAGFETLCGNAAAGILENIRTETEGLNIKFGKQIKYCGETVSGILEQIQKENYDLVLMGSHGKKGLQRWLGSVSRDVINNINIASYVSKKCNNCQKVLFAADGSSNSRFAVSEAIKYLDLNNKEIYIVIVLENPSLLFLEGALDSKWLMEIEEQQNKYATRVILNVQDKLKQHNLNADKFAILQGNPAEKIAEFSKAEDIDLIITGTRHTAKHRFHGSVSKRILEISSSDAAIFK